MSTSKQDNLMAKIVRLTAVIGRELAAYSIILMATLVFVGVVFRAVPGLPSLRFVEEYAGYLFVAVTFFGLGDTFVAGGHVRVSLFTQWLHGRVALLLEVIVTIVGLLIVSLLTYFAWKIFWASFVSGERAQTMMQTEVWIPRSVMVPGYIIFALQMLHHLVLTTKQLLAPSKAASSEA